MTNWVKMFTGLLFYAYVGIHQVRVLVFDNNYQNVYIHGSISQSNTIYRQINCQHYHKDLCLWHHFTSTTIELKLGAVLALFHIGWCAFNEFNNGLNAKSYPPYFESFTSLYGIIFPLSATWKFRGWNLRRTWQFYHHWRERIHKGQTAGSDDFWKGRPWAVTGNKTNRSRHRYSRQYIYMSFSKGDNLSTFRLLMYKYWV